MLCKKVRQELMPCSTLLSRLRNQVAAFTMRASEYPMRVFKTDMTIYGGTMNNHGGPTLLLVEEDITEIEMIRDENGFPTKGDRKSVVEGTRVTLRVNLGGSIIIKKKKK